MTIDVYPWPPVAPRKWLWTWDHPVSVSPSVVDGAEDISQAFAPRRVAHVEVHGRRDGHAAGFMEMLKRLLEGQVNAVRLESWPVNWHLDATRSKNANASLLQWTDGGPVTWTDDGAPVQWIQGAPVSSINVLATGWTELNVSVPTANALVVRPGEYIDVVHSTGTITAQVLAPAYSNAGGTAVVRVLETLPALSDAAIYTGQRDSAVFRATKLPMSPQNVEGDWTFAWEFRQVFELEAGGFNELETSPWG